MILELKPRYYAIITEMRPCLGAGVTLNGIAAMLDKHGFKSSITTTRSHVLKMVDAGLLTYDPTKHSTYQLTEMVRTGKVLWIDDKPVLRVSKRDPALASEA